MRSCRKKTGPCGVQLDQEGYQQEQGREKDKPQQGRDEIEGALAHRRCCRTSCLDRVDDALGVGFGQLGIDRERDDALEDGAGVGEVFRAISEGVAVIGMEMQGNEMHARPDVLLPEQLDEFIAADAQLFQVQLNHIEVPGMLYLRRHIGHSDLWDVFEALVVPARTALPELPKPVTLLELLDPQGGGHIRQVVFVARIQDLVVPRTLRGIALPGVVTDPMQAHDAHALGPLRILGCGHAAFARW